MRRLFRRFESQMASDYEPPSMSLSPPGTDMANVSGALPSWVYELVMDLAEQQEIHPRLLFESGAFEGTRQYDWCPCNALAIVPTEVKAQAAAIAGYRRERRPT